jgi:hypothetical protein
MVRNRRSEAGRLRAGTARRRGGLWLLIALAIGAGAISLAWAQSGGGYSLNLNSPVSFPVDI